MLAAHYGVLTIREPQGNIVGSHAGFEIRADECRASTNSVYKFALLGCELYGLGVRAFWMWALGFRLSASGLKGT